MKGSRTMVVVSHRPSCCACVIAILKLQAGELQACHPFEGQSCRWMSNVNYRWQELIIA